jgi:hypothetical protein
MLRPCPGGVLRGSASFLVCSTKYRHGAQKKEKPYILVMYGCNKLKLQSINLSIAYPDIAWKIYFTIREKDQYSLMDDG